MEAELLKLQKSGQFPDELVKIEGAQIHYVVGHPIDSGMGLSITIDKLRVFINKTLSTQSLINQLLIKRVGLSIVIDNGKIGPGMRSCKCTNHNLYAGRCQ